MKKSIYLIIIFVVVLSFEARSEGLDFPDNYQEINAEHIASMEQELSADRIDGSDGLDFWPGTYFIYKTNMGRYGKFIVEDLVETAGSKLTISWLTYDSDGSAYSSGSGLEIRGSWHCDLDEGLEEGYVQGQQDWQWRLMNPSSRYLLPVNGAKFKLIYKASSPSAQTEEPVHFDDANLKAVVEEALGITDPTPADMLGLTSLRSKDDGIGNLTGLEYATNLQRLEIEWHQVSDLRPLSGLTSLQYLSLENNEIGGNQISDISPLSGLINLRDLDLDYNLISDISPVSGLVNLQELSLYKNRISDISPLSGLTSLRELYLEDNQISDISILVELPNLVRLGLGDNEINDISVIAELHNLVYLSLGENQISNILPISGLTNLETLYLYDNQISDISLLSSLTNLQYLSIFNNQISDISPLSGLTNLHSLFLGDNRISDISTLSGLTNLTDLSLNDSQISDISVLSGLTNLEWLNLQNNQISDVSVLSVLTGLRHIALYNNQISDISPLSGLTNLYYLDLRANQLGTDAYTIYIPIIQGYGTTVSYDPPVWRTLTISSTTGGSVVEPGEGDFDYANLIIVNVSAVPDPGYYFVNWTGTAVDDGKVADPAAAGTNVTVEADFTLQANFEQIRLALYVDDDAPDDPAPNNPQVSDPGEDGSPEHPYDTIQESIDVAEYGDTVLVYPGIYKEEIIFLGKAITVQGVAASDGIPALENPGDFAVSFYYGEGPESVLKNFVIRNSFMGIFIAGSSPTISNVTVVDNKYGIEAYADSEPDISNSIFWSNTDGDLFQCEAWYSCFKGISRDTGQGNIDADPLFVDPNSGDYHLRSERGRHWPEHDVWVLDNITSPCIDAGNPMVDPSDEPVPNGARLNMGAYGGTHYASMSESPVTGIVLPPEVVEQVHGITGGFHYDSTWFIAKFHNGSNYTITRVTINIRLTDKITDEQQWYEVVLGPPGAVIPPGETVILSGDVGVTRGDKDFYWEIVKMVGYID